MRESNAGEAPGESTPSPLPYQDRSAGLVVFGVLTILLGGLAGLFALLMLAQFALLGTTNAQVNLTALLPGIAMYGGLAVALVWLGVGSIMARRWARALLLIFSWTWLVMGVLTFVAAAFFVPRALANLSSGGANGSPALPAGARDLMLTVMFVIYGVFLAIMPAVWTFFYSSRHVKATCEARDPVPRWTDACPLPVLGLCLWSLFSATGMLVMPVAANGVMPFFGTFLAGAPGTIFCLVLACVWLYAAWSLYKLEPRGWWVMLIVFGVALTSGLITFARHDPMEMYRLMNFPEGQIEQIQKMGLLKGNFVVWMVFITMLPFISYLLFVKKFLRPSA